MATVTENKKYPLYSAELAGYIYDGKTRYEMVIITQWTDRTERAKEISHKTFYFLAPRNYLEKYKNDEEWCAKVFVHNEYKRFQVEEGYIWK